MMLKTATISLVVLLVMASPGLAQVGITLGTEYGFGVAAQMGSRAAKLEAGVGFMPVLAFWEIKRIGPYGTSEDSYLKFYMPVEVGAKLNFSPTGPDENRLGVKLGASYNTVLKAGFGGGIDYQISKDKSKYVTVSAGFMYFPKAYDELLQKLNEAEGEHFTKDDVSAVLLGFRPFIALSIFFGG